MKNIKKMRSRNIFFASLLLFAFMLVGFASATTTINSPASSGTVSGSFIFNVTTTDVTEIGIPVDVLIYAMSTSTANSTWSLIGQNSSLNLSATDIVNNSLTSLSTSVIEDASDYIFNATIQNASSDTFLGDGTVSSVIVDNTIPTAPSSLSPTSSDRSVDFSATVVGENTTVCTLSFAGTNPGSSSYTMTHSGDECTHSLTNVADGTYPFTITASDGTNSSESSETIVTVDEVTGTGGNNTVGGASSGGLGLMIVAIIIIVGIIWMARIR